MEAFHSHSSCFSFVSERKALKVPGVKRSMASEARVD